MTTFPDFSQVPLMPGNQPPAAADGLAAWAKRFKAETGRAAEEMIWQTPEGIRVKPFYSAKDLEGLDHLDTAPGLPPYLRGPYSSM